MTKKVTSKKVANALSSWRKLNEDISSLTEAELEQAVELEKARDTPRSTVLKRLNQRLWSLKAASLKAEMGE